MPFHRLTLPTYSGGLPGTHDYINNAGGGTPAPASPQQAIGTYAGTYLEVPGESATAANVNRANVALAENADFIDDILNTSQPTPAFAQDLGAGQTNLQVLTDVFVGKSGLADTQDNRDLLAVVVDSSGNEVVDAAGVRVVISEIRESTNSGNVIGTEATGYHTNPYFHFNVAMPAGVTFRIIFFVRGTFTSFADPSGSGQMGDLTGRLLTNLGRQLAWTTPFEAGNGTWADASNLVSTTAQEAIDETVNSLGAAAGATLIGAAAYVGVSTTLVLGTISSQLQQLVDELGGLAATNTWTAINTFELAPVFEEETIRIGLASGGVPDAYDQSGAFIGGATVTTPGNTSPALEISPGNPNNQDGAPIIINTGGVKGNGFDKGILHMMFGGLGADMNNLRRSIVPTQVHRIDDGVGPINLAQYENVGAEWEGSDVPASTTVLLEAYVVAVGDDGSSTAAEDAFGCFIRRARGQRNIAGTRSVSTSSANQIVFEDHNLDETGSPAVVDIVATSTGFRIAVTSPGGLTTQDLIWWGYLIMTPITWTASPDQINP